MDSVAKPPDVQQEAPEVKPVAMEVKQEVTEAAMHMKLSTGDVKNGLFGPRKLILHTRTNLYLLQLNLVPF